MRRKWKPKLPGGGSKVSSPKLAPLTVLDSFSVGSIKKANRLRDDLLKYELDYYWELAVQRVQTFSQLQSSLTPFASQFSFKNWQRCVKYRWSLEPLSSKGSLIDPGGRFNIGEIDPVQYATFPALYLASDRETAEQEVLGQAPKGSGLSYYQLALANPASISVVSVSGNIESVLDLRKKDSLKSFLELIRNFKIPFSLIQSAKKLAQKIPIKIPRVIRTLDELLDSLLEEEWKVRPMQFDIPSNSQIFGQIASSGGIEAIVYPSKITAKDCLAIFPKNFQSSSSFVELDDPAPPGCLITRLDVSTWIKTI